MTEKAEDKSFLTKLKEIYRTANQEHANAKLGQRATLISTLGALAFEWGSGNEAMIGLVAGQMHELTHNPIATGLVTGSASFAEQGAIGALMAATIQSYPEVTAKVREIVGGNDEAKDSRLKQYGGAMILGAGLELAKENAIRPHDKAENTRRAFGSAGMIAASNTALIAGLSGLLKLGEENGFESTAEVVVDVASNPLTYAGIILGVVGYNRARRVFRKRKSTQHSDELQQDIPDEEAVE